MSDRDDDLVPLERNPVDLEARRYKFRRTKLLIHGADSPWENSSKRIPNFIKNESEPNFNAD
jgi:hypothetical protein